MDKFFLKYEGGKGGAGGGERGGGGVKLTPPQEKLPSKNPALLGLSMRITRWIIKKKPSCAEKIARKKVELQETFFCWPRAFSYESLILDQSN